MCVEISAFDSIGKQHYLVEIKPSQENWVIEGMPLRTYPALPLFLCEMSTSLSMHAPPKTFCHITGPKGAGPIDH